MTGRGSLDASMSKTKASWVLSIVLQFHTEYKDEFIDYNPYSTSLSTASNRFL